MTKCQEVCSNSSLFKKNRVKFRQNFKRSFVFNGYYNMRFTNTVKLCYNFIYNFILYVVMMIFNHFCIMPSEISLIN